LQHSNPNGTTKHFHATLARSSAATFTTSCVYPDSTSNDPSVSYSEFNTHSGADCDAILAAYAYSECFAHFTSESYSFSFTCTAAHSNSLASAIKCSHSSTIQPAYATAVATANHFTLFCANAAAITSAHVVADLCTFIEPHHQLHSRFY
jgi:hypothetical protein